MGETAELVGRIFREYQNGNSPRTEMTHQTEDGKTTAICVQTGRGDMVVAEHITGAVFAAIRIEGVEESQSSRIQRTARNPNASYEKQFDHCEYQMIVFEDARVRDGGGANAVYQACNWNTGTSVRTTNSERQLTTQWREYVQRARQKYDEQADS